MTSTDRMKLLRTVVAEHGQATVARRIGRSTAAINRILKGTYPNPERVLELIDAEYGSAEVDCPVMGRVSLARCIEERNKPFRATNPQRRQLYLACQHCSYKD